MILFLPLNFLATLYAARAALVNVTIDDEFGDEGTGVVPSYAPVGAWAQGSTCSRCLVKPDPRQAFRSTWHDATHTPGDVEPRVANVQFNGSAIYAYFIVANFVESATTLVNLTFTLDGSHVGDFVHIPSSDTSYGFNVPGYVNESMPHTQHQLNIIATGDTNSSNVLFDYAVYTFDTESSSVAASGSATTRSNPTASASNAPFDITPSPTTKGVNVAAVAGGVIGCLVLLTVAFIAVIFLRRRRIRRPRADEIVAESSRDMVEIEPFVGPGTSENGSRSGTSHQVAAIAGTSRTNRTGSLPTLLTSSSNYTLQSQAGQSNEDPNVSSQALILPRPWENSTPSSRSLMVPAVRGKVAQQRDELNQQVRKMQQTIADLSARRRSLPRPPEASSRGGSSQGLRSYDPASSSGPGSSNSNSETALRNQITELQERVEQLQAQQEHLRGMGLGDEPPPEYEEGDRGIAEPSSGRASSWAGTHMQGGRRVRNDSSSAGTPPAETPEKSEPVSERTYGP